VRAQTVNEAELARQCGGLIEAGRTHFGAAESWGLVFFWLFPEVQQPSCESWELACPILPRKSYLAPPQRRSKSSLPDRESENQLPSFLPLSLPSRFRHPLLPLFPLPPPLPWILDTDTVSKEAQQELKARWEGPGISSRRQIIDCHVEIPNPWTSPPVGVVRSGNPSSTMVSSVLKFPLTRLI
jgi:hypothetical protein